MILEKIDYFQNKASKHNLKQVPQGTRNFAIQINTTRTKFIPHMHDNTAGVQARNLNKNATRTKLYHDHQRQANIVIF